MARADAEITLTTLDAAGGALISAGGVAGDILLHDGTSFKRFAKGAAYTQLRTKADGSQAAWLPRHDYGPQDVGFLAWAFDNASVFSGSTTTTGQLQLIKMRAPEAISVTNIVMGIVTGAVVTTGAVAGIYQGTTLLGSTADQITPWASAGIKTMAIAGGAVPVAAGDFFVGFFWAGGASPSFARGCSGLGTAFLNNTLASPNMRFSTANASLTTTLPSPFTTQTGSAAAFWAGVT